MKCEEALRNYGRTHSFPILLFDPLDKKLLHSTCGFMYKSPLFASSLIITVTHLFEDTANNNQILIFNGFDDSGCPKYKSRRMVSIKPIQRSTDVRKNVDLSFGLLELGEKIFNIAYDPEGANAEKLIECEPFSCISNANIAENYYFFGATDPQFHIDSNSMVEKHYALHECFEIVDYIGEDEYSMQFELSKCSDFPSDKYKGCSGTPIFNSQGELVSMVTGHEGNVIIKGVNLYRILPIIEMYLSSPINLNA